MFGLFFSVLDDHIYEMKRVTVRTVEDQHLRSILTLTLTEPSTN